MLNTELFNFRRESLATDIFLAEKSDLRLCSRLSFGLYMIEIRNEDGDFLTICLDKKDLFVCRCKHRIAGAIIRNPKCTRKYLILIAKIIKKYGGNA